MLHLSTLPLHIPPLRTDTLQLGILWHHSEIQVEGLFDRGAMQDDSLDKITSPSLQHCKDARKLEGTGERQQSEISQEEITLQNDRPFCTSSELHFHRRNPFHFILVQNLSSIFKYLLRKQAKPGQGHKFTKY